MSKLFSESDKRIV